MAWSLRENILFREIGGGLKEGKTLLGYFFVQMVGLAMTMLVPLVVANFFSKDLFGRYSLSEMVIFFFVAFLVGAIKVPFIVSANNERVNSGKINKSFSVQVIFLFASVLLFLAVSTIFKGPLMRFAKISGGEFLFLGLGFLGFAFKDFLGNLFLALNERLKQAFVEAAFGLSALSCIFIFYLVNRINLKSVFFAYFISSIIVFVIFLKVINVKLLLPLVFDKRHFTEIFHFTKWVTFGAGAAYFINWGDNLVLRYFVSMDEIGVYNLAYKFFKGLTALVYLMPSYFLPFISENINNPEKIRHYLAKKRPKIFLAGCVGLIIAFLVTPHFLNLIYQHKYDDAAPVLRILIVATALLLYAAFYSPVFYAFKKYKFAQVASVIQVVINLILDVILVPFVGISGAAIATMCGYLFLVVSCELYFRCKVKRLFESVDSAAKS